ncbi:unnamed protein product [Lota lota]
MGVWPLSLSTPLRSPSMDPLQFAYEPGIGVWMTLSSTSYIRSLSHLDMAGSTGRITFFGLSSAYDAMQPTEGQVGAHRGGAPPPSMAPGPPHQPTTVWGISISTADGKRLNRLVQKGSSVADATEVVLGKESGVGKAILPDGEHAPPHA